MKKVILMTLGILMLAGCGNNFKPDVPTKATVSKVQTKPVFEWTLDKADWEQEDTYTEQLLLMLKTIDEELFKIKKKRWSLSISTYNTQEYIALLELRLHVLDRLRILSEPTDIEGRYTK